MDYQALTQTVLDCGATKSTIIEASAIVSDAAFRKMCADNRCGVYGKCYMCPPDVGPIDELMALLYTYDKGVLYQVICPLEDSYDIEGMVAAKKEFVGLNQRVIDALKPILGDKALFLGGGGCGLCEKCAKITDEPCRYPDRAIPSMESYGIDVYNTTRSTPLKYINGPETVTYFGLVLFKEHSDG